MSVIKKPDLSDPKLRAKLAKGMGHNYYGEVRIGNLLNASQKIANLLV
jgi:hypothetical protein